MRCIMCYHQWDHQLIWHLSWRVSALLQSILSQGEGPAVLEHHLPLVNFTSTIMYCTHIKYIKNTIMSKNILISNMKSEVWPKCFVSQLELFIIGQCLAWLYYHEMVYLSFLYVVTDDQYMKADTVGIGINQFSECKTGNMHAQQTMAGLPNLQPAGIWKRHCRFIESIKWRE